MAIERPDYILHRGQPLKNGEGFVRLDNLSKQALSLLIGVDALVITEGPEKQSVSKLQGITGIVRNNDLYGPDSAILHTEGNVRARHDKHVDEWMQQQLAARREAIAVTEAVLRNAATKRRL